MGGRGANWTGRLGLSGALLLWAGSISALVVALRINEAASHLAMTHGVAVAARGISRLRGVAVMWGLVLAGLQVGAMLLGAGVLRAAYRLRVAVCFAVSGGTLVVLNGLWLLGLLVWLRFTGGTGEVLLGGWAG